MFNSVRVWNAHCWFLKCHVRNGKKQWRALEREQRAEKEGRRTRRNGDATLTLLAEQLIRKINARICVCVFMQSDITVLQQLSNYSNLIFYIALLLLIVGNTSWFDRKEFKCALMFCSMYIVFVILLNPPLWLSLMYLFQQRCLHFFPQHDW